MSKGGQSSIKLLVYLASVKKLLKHFQDILFHEVHPALWNP